MDMENYVPNDVYYAKAGIKLKCLPWSFLGITRPYVEYGRVNDGIYDNEGFFVAGHQDFYGGGVVQDVDAAAMQLWIRARVLTETVDPNFVGDNPIIPNPTFGNKLKDFTEVVGGAFIAF
jgi:hypothetical protein